MSYTTTAKGYRKPSAGDKGSGASGWFTSLEFNIDRLDGHSHNGSDSAVLKSGNVQATTQAITSGSWVSVGGGRYRQLVTMPTSPTTMQFDNYMPVFKLTSTGEPLQGLGIEKVSATTFYVYTNDNTQNVTIFYLS